jgi:hypothetical protein
MKEGKVGCEGGWVEEGEEDSEVEVISSNKLITSAAYMKVYG